MWPSPVAKRGRGETRRQVATQGRRGWAGRSPQPRPCSFRYDMSPLSPPSVTFGTIQASDLSSTEEELPSLRMQSKKHPELRSQVPLTVQKPHSCSKDK